MLDEDRYWQALCERDAAFDGRFVFAVRSTGIFCRPSCPARRPARERVAFYADGEAARVAGFRPCRRCSPLGPSPSQQLDALVVAACRLLDDAVTPLTLPQLAARIGLSPAHLSRAFKARTGLTPHVWAAARRRERLDGADDLSVVLLRNEHQRLAQPRRQARLGLSNNDPPLQEKSFSRRAPP